MKKMSMVCMLVMCLVMQGKASPALTPLVFYLNESEQETERLRETLKDKKKLRECLDVVLGNHTSLGGALEFMRKFDVDEEPMRHVLTDIIREVIAKTGGKISERYRERTPEIMQSSWRMREALKWMGACADADGRRLLLGIATDNGKHHYFRAEAIHSYMRRADVQEKWDAIARFLADDVRPGILAIFNVYHAAMQAYDEAEGDTQKREAIVAAVSAALMKDEEKGTFVFIDGELFKRSKEEDKKAFEDADKALAKRSKEYADSPQRKAALERMNKPPEKETP